MPNELSDLFMCKINSLFTHQYFPADSIPVVFYCSCVNYNQTLNYWFLQAKLKKNIQIIVCVQQEKKKRKVNSYVFEMKPR